MSSPESCELESSTCKLLPSSPPPSPPHVGPTPSAYSHLGWPGSTIAYPTIAKIPVCEGGAPPGSGNVDVRMCPSVQGTTTSKGEVIINLDVPGKREMQLKAPADEVEVWMGLLFIGNVGGLEGSPPLATL